VSVRTAKSRSEANKLVSAVFKLALQMHGQPISHVLAYTH